MHLIPNSSSYRILVYVKNNCSTTPTPHKLFFDKTPVSTKKEYASSLRDSIFAGLTPAFTGGQSHSERFVSFNFHFAASVTLCTPSPQYHRLRIQILGAYLCQICFFFCSLCLSSTVMRAHTELFVTMFIYSVLHSPSLRWMVWWYCKLIIRCLNSAMHLSIFLQIGN